MNAENILQNKKDKLGERVLAQGIPTFENVAGLMPYVSKGGYVFLSGVASQGAILVDRNGNCYDQEQPGMACGSMLAHATPFFCPAEEDYCLEGKTARFSWVDNCSILQWWYDNLLQAEAFVHPLDPSIHPILFLRIAYPERKTRYYCFCTSGLQDVWPNTRMEISAEKYLSEREDTLQWWKENSPCAQIYIGDDRWHKLLKRTLINGLITFSGGRPRYGHAYYGLGQGDNFPPAFITMAETLLMAGDTIRAAALVDYVFCYIVRADGAFAYYGPTAAEYGQWLFISERITRRQRIFRHMKKIRKIVEHLLSMRQDNGLIVSGAEADTRFRIAVYMNNNLWAVRGLEAAAAMVEDWGEDGAFYRQAAEDLLCATQQAMKSQAVQTEYGEIPPFRLNYAALPWTLSSCRETTTPVAKEELERYLKDGYPCGEIRDVQDLSENTYANYRYYPEMLSSGLLEKKQAQAILKMRRNAGGELLGMTRLFSWLDDWPIFHIARHLLETGQREQYLLLLHAHAMYHGDLETGVYYEQVDCAGNVVTEDCIPSILAIPLMLFWCLVFEPVGEKVLLLGAGTSPKWYAGEVRAYQIGCSFGKVSWVDRPCGNGQREFTYELPPITIPVQYIPPCGRTFSLVTNPHTATKGCIYYSDSYGESAVYIKKEEEP